MSSNDENENNVDENNNNNNNNNESNENEENENNENNNNNNNENLENEENEEDENILKENNDNNNNNENNENTTNNNNNNEEFFEDELNITEFINDFKNREIEYNEKIKELEKDLLIERSKSDTTKNSSEKLIKKFKEEIAEKDKEIKNILINNSKQRKKLEQLSKQVDLQLNKMNYKIISDKIKKEKMNQIKKNNKNLNKNSNNNNKNSNKII